MAQNRIDLHAAPLNAQLLAQSVNELWAAALGAVGGYPCDHLVQLIVRIRGKGETLRDVRAGAALDRRLVPQLFGPIRVPRKSCPAGDGFTARNGLAAGNIFAASDDFAFGYDFAAGYGFAARAVGRRCPLVAEYGHPDAVGKLERAGPLDRVDNERGLALRIDE